MNAPSSGREAFPRRGAPPGVSRRQLRIRGRLAATTPLIVPAYSSAAQPRCPVGRSLALTRDAVLGPILVSAYDVGSAADGRFQPDELRHAPLVLLDSGGYETSLPRHPRPDPWTRAAYVETLRRWPSGIPTVAVSYDDPGGTPGDQAERARHLFDGLDVGRCLLLKPPAGEAFLRGAWVAPHVGALAAFDVLGVTEKEAGASLVDRMRLIASLRAALADAGSDIPIHVFGGLDPVLTPLYLMAGADICDGLAWLRYAMADGRAAAMQPHVALAAPEADIDAASWSARRANLRAIGDLQIAMRRLASGVPPAAEVAWMDRLRDVVDAAFPAFS